MRPVGLTRAFGAALVGVALLAVGCSASDGSDTSTSGDQAERIQTSKPEQNSGKASSAKKTPQDLPVKSQEQQSIIGMHAGDVLTAVQKPGLGCWQPVDRDVLYACGSEEGEDLLYEIEITGRSTDQVSGVEARVFNQGSEDFELASLPFLGLLAAELEYRGSNREQAYKFINRNLSSAEASARIGAARWTMTTSDDSGVLTLTPAE